MAGVRFLDLVSPFAPYIPGVIAPQRKIPFNQRLLWTVVVLLIFLIMSEIPLYGIVSSDSSDPIMWLRMMLASNRGTLMELGITPIMSSSMVFQLLMATGLVEVNGDSRRDRELLQSAQKFLAIILSFGQATVYVLTGMYGVPSSLGTGVCLLLILQLVFAAVIVILLDELLQKGYGLGSGTSLFVATNTCEQVVWKCFSPKTVTDPKKGPRFEGAFLALVHLLATRRNKKLALIEAFTRKDLPNMSQALVTLGIFFVVVYLQTLRVDIQVRSAKARGVVASYPIRLFYTSNTPIMLQSALSQNIVMLSQLLFSRYPENAFARLLGVWDTAKNGQLLATRGIAYYVQPPMSWLEIRADPIKTIIYVVFVLTVCASFSKLWLEVSGTGPRDIARQFRDQELTIVGSRDTSAYKELKRLIPTAATLGGAAIGFLSVTSDLLGGLGSGTGMLLAVTTIYGYYEAANENGNKFF